MELSQIAEIALSEGFTYAVPAEPLRLICEPEIRAYCNPEQCPRYGLTWVCPPGCGTLEECRERAGAFNRGLVLQSVSLLRNGYDEEELALLSREHNKRLLRLSDEIRRNGADSLPLSTGGCVVCEKCAYPDSPCRHPDRRMHSLSAYGINVSKLCEAAGLDFSFREDMIYFTACLLCG